MTRYPNCLLTFAVFCLLFPPYLMQRYGGHEPYPAIILPASANKVDVKATEVSFERLSLWAKNIEGDAWVEIEPESFLEPIPIQYLSTIVNNSFGFDSLNGRQINLPGNLNFLSRKITADEIEQTKLWLRQKLNGKGFRSNEIMITLEQVNFDTITNKIVSKTVSSEQILRLH